MEKVSMGVRYAELYSYHQTLLWLVSQGEFLSNEEQNLLLLGIAQIMKNEGYDIPKLPPEEVD
jgi:hypothetical protein